jgi:hypothetical protein
MDQIDYLGTRVGLVNQKGWSTLIQEGSDYTKDMVNVT